ncbi:MAG: zinc ribbon domain-containing protein [Caldilineaceae bacterium]|jgi:hypothetical protein
MSVPIQWRTKKQRYSLRGSVCPVCSNVMFPPRDVCPNCAGENGVNRHHLLPSSEMSLSLAPQAVLVTSGGDD